MKDFTETIEEDEVPLCPLCDQPMVFLASEIVVARAHDCVFIAHRDCSEEMEGEEVEA